MKGKGFLGDKYGTGEESPIKIKEPEVKGVGPSDFAPLNLLGTGSFGEVHLVRHISSGKLYALKILFKSEIEKNNLTKYALNERNVLTYTKHPFIVSLHYAFQTKQKLFLLLDYCPGYIYNIYIYN